MRQHWLSHIHRSAAQPYLGTGGARVLGHTLEHLRGADGGLAREVALGQDLLGGQKHPLGRDLNTAQVVQVYKFAVSR